MRKTAFLASLVILLATVLLPGLAKSQSFNPRYVNVNANSGGFYEYLPAGYSDPANANKTWPVIIFIHGVGEYGNGTSDLYKVKSIGIAKNIDNGWFPSSFNVNGNNYSFIVISPQFKGWPSPGDIESYLNYIQNNYRADLNRLYLTGLSMGGGITWDYAGSSVYASKRLAAIVPICGASTPDAGKIRNMVDGQLPVLATHNLYDDVVNVSVTNQYVDGMNSLGVNPAAVKVIFDEWPHNAWTRTYETSTMVYGNLNVYQWMLLNSRGSATPPPPPPPSTSPISVTISNSSNPTCANAYNGTATASISGGSGPYTYSWNTSPVQTGATATNLGPGTYTVIARDVNNNAASAQVTLTDPQPLAISVNPGSITTYGGVTNVSLGATGGTPAYTFTGPVSNVSAGTYTYTVRDAKGCGDSKSITITQPAQTTAGLSAVISAKGDLKCYGATNGYATVSASGGTAPYTYSWSTSPVQTQATANNLSAGNYTVTVRDAAGQTTTASVTLTESPRLLLTVNAGTISTYGGTTSVSLSATGGASPYTFSGPTSSVKAGTYDYTVTDANGCVDAKQVTITEPGAPAPPPTPTLSASISAKGDLKCYGATNGYATVSASGGTAPYTYSWSTSPVQTQATANNLTAGSYTVTVRDAAGQTTTASVTLTESPRLLLTVNAGTITTYGGTTSVSLSATGGASPYTFSGPTSSVKAGTYNYAVTDANGCVDAKQVTISEPAAPAPPPPPATPALSASVTDKADVKCFGATNGYATVSASGGTAPYTYSWSTSPAQTQATANNLGAGNYTVTVKDAAGQSTTASVTINESPRLLLTVDAGTISTYGGTTSVNLSATGGTSPYTFSGPTSSVKAGTYDYAVTDANGCVDAKQVTIAEPGAPAPPPPPSTQPTALKASVGAVSNISCFGNKDGYARIDVSGGKAPYTYSWSLGSSTGNEASGLSAGNYLVKVQDADQQQVEVSFQITEPKQLTLNVSAQPIREFGGSTSVSLQAVGGTSPYTFSGPVDNVTAGNYTYKVVDAKGCNTSKDLTLTQPDALVLEANAGNITCFGGTTNVSLRVRGGIAPYTFEGDTVAVKAGTHVYTVIDAANVRKSASIYITEPARLDLIATSGLITKRGGRTDVQLVASGGTAPYAYTGDTTNVKAGTYTYTATDAVGCSSEATIEVREPNVKLTSFDAVKTDSSVDLKWATSYEYAIDHFEIDRISDNSTPSTVSSVSSLWSSMRVARYFVTDTRPLSKRNLYKISAITSYGEKIELDTREVTFLTDKLISVKNLTTMADITVSDPYMGTLVVTMSDMNGRVLQTRKFEKQTYLWNTKWSFQGLPAGSYVISLNGPSIKYAKVVVKPQ